jgi:hypothetical protein
MTDRELWIAVFQQAFDAIMQSPTLKAPDNDVAGTAAKVADLAVKRCPSTVSRPGSLDAVREARANLYMHLTTDETYIVTKSTMDALTQAIG